MELVHVKLMVQDSIDTAKSLYASVRRQDAESVLDLFADNAMLHGPTSSTKILPWGGTYNGKEGVKQFFKLLEEGLDIEQFDIIDFIAERDKVATWARRTPHRRCTAIRVADSFQ